jgi:uncharacterized protein (DUF362 family)
MENQVKRISRRQFLRCCGVGLGTLIVGPTLAACQPLFSPTSPPSVGPGTPPGIGSLSPPPTLAPPSPTPTQTPVPPSPTHPPAALQPDFSPTPTAVPPSPTPIPTYPHLAVAQGGEPEDLVRRALNALGGIRRFVRRGDNVIIKPNICVAYRTYEYAATTNPWVVGALVRMCLEAGARRVRVMDHPFGGTPEEAYVNSGIAEQVRAVGGEMEVMSPFKFVETDLPQAWDLRRWAIYEDVLNADVVINVPIAKHHGLARLTLGMKNLMGVIWERPPLHFNLGQRLADLTSRIRPALTVIDAVRVLTAHGPTGGDLADVRKLDTVIASPDIVAADAFAATLFGLRPDDLDYVRAGVAMGLGRSDLENLTIAYV